MRTESESALATQCFRASQAPVKSTSEAAEHADRLTDRTDRWCLNIDSETAQLKPALRASTSSEALGQPDWKTERSQAWRCDFQTYLLESETLKNRRKQRT